MVLWIFWECWVRGPSGFGEHCKSGGPSRFVESCGLDGSGWASLLNLAISGYLLIQKELQFCSIVMDFDNPKVYGETPIFDGLVLICRGRCFSL